MPLPKRRQREVQRRLAMRDTQWQDLTPRDDE